MVRLIDFPTMTIAVDLGRNATKQTKGPIEQKLPKMVYIIPNFLVLHFRENFIKIKSKIPKLQMHECE